MASTATKTLEIPLSPALPGHAGYVIQVWTIVMGTAANSCAVTSAVSGLKTVYPFGSPGIVTTSVLSTQAPIFKAVSGGAFTVYQTKSSAKTCYVTVLGKTTK